MSLLDMMAIKFSATTFLVNSFCELQLVNDFKKQFYSSTVVQPDYTNWYRPCSLTDFSCIRNYFISNGWCSSVQVPMQSSYRPLKINNVPTELSCSNATMYSDMVVTGLQNGVVSEL